MQAVFYSGFSKKNNSTKVPTISGTTKSIVLKENTSLLNPTFIINEVNYTYNYVQWAGRYYFITDIVTTSNSIAEYQCKVDVLASWKSYIGASSQYVIRSASGYDTNGYIIDNKYPVKTNFTRHESELGWGSFVNTIASGSYVVGVVNHDVNAIGGICYYVMTDAQFRSLCTFLLSDVNWLNISADELSEGLQKALIDPFQYVKSVMWFPFIPTAIPSDSVSKVYLGWWEFQVSCRRLTGGTLTDIFNYTPHSHYLAATRGKYLNRFPFTRRQLNFVCFGSINLDPILDGRTDAIKLRCTTDFTTGSARLDITESNLIPLYTKFGSMGVPIQISQVKQNLIQGGLDLINTVTSAASGYAIGVVNGITSATSDFMPRAESKGSTGSLISFYAQPSVITDDYTPVDESITHMGRPVCSDKVINTLSGFILVDDADVDIPCTNEERSEIITYMKSGFYYE